MSLFDALPAMLRGRLTHEPQTTPGLFYCWRVLNFYTGATCPWCGKGRRNAA